MRFGARIQNNPNEHQVTLNAGDNEHTLPIAPRTGGGSSVTGGELLFLALATCYCNDIYREAAAKNIRVNGVEVEVEGDFEAPGRPATNVVYRAKIDADATEEQIRELMLHTDSVAEIQNTLRLGTPVRLEL